MSACIFECLTRAGWSGCFKWKSILVLAVLVAGCKTPCYEEGFSIPFDAPKIVRLSHESYKAAWDAEYWALYDLRTAAFHPLRLDRQTLVFLRRLRWQVAWIARDVEKHPASPRCSSKSAYDIVAFDEKMLKLRYQPASFTPSTDLKIEKLLNLLDEIAPYYEMKKPVIR